jgi:dihydrofolate reductase
MSSGAPPGPKGMRDVVLYELLSLDGVAEEPGDWMVPGGDALIDNLARVIAPQDAVLLGRGTYDDWAGYWPTADMQPFADFVNGTEKHVFTSSTPVLEWPNSTFVRGPAETYVADLKARDGGDIGIHGSIALAQSLLHAGLVDELRLVVSPTTAGRGRRLFVDGQLQRWELVDLDRTASGLLLLGYRRSA